MAPPTMLIVDDEESIVFALRRYFSKRGYAVECAATPGEAYVCLERTQFDVVLADLRLVGFDGHQGLDVLAAARERSATACTVLLTAFKAPEIEAQACDVGVDLVFQKPQPLEVLAAAVSRLVSERRIDAG